MVNPSGLVSALAVGGMLRETDKREASLEELLAERIAERVAETVAEKFAEKAPAESGDTVAWLTMRQAAKRTGIDYSAISKAVRLGEIPSYAPLGRKRIDPTELDEWVRSQRVENTTTVPLRLPQPGPT